MKAVAFRASFKGSDFSDALMDRMVLVDADLTNAIFSRAVFSRSDFTGAKVENADFSGALIDKPQQILLCKVANGMNPQTKVDTRKSLGCSGSGARRSTPRTRGRERCRESPLLYLLLYKIAAPLLHRHYRLLFRSFFIRQAAEVPNLPTLI